LKKAISDQLWRWKQAKGSGFCFSGQLSAISFQRYVVSSKLYAVTCKQKNNQINYTDEEKK